MKKLILLLSLCSLSALCALGGEPTPGIADVSDLAQIKVQTPDLGVVVAGDVRDVLANYPQLAKELKQKIEAGLKGEDDDLAAAKRWKELQARDVPLSQAATDALDARLEALGEQKEEALLVVKDRDPARAKTKMEELLAAGVPITDETQTAVNDAQPTPEPSATPEPTPNDGL